MYKCRIGYSSIWMKNWMSFFFQNVCLRLDFRPFIWDPPKFLQFSNCSSLCRFFLIQHDHYTHAINDGLQLHFSNRRIKVIFRANAGYLALNSTFEMFRPIKMNVFVWNSENLSMNIVDRSQNNGGKRPESRQTLIM